MRGSSRVKSFFAALSFIISLLMGSLLTLQSASALSNSPEWSKQYVPEGSYSATSANNPIARDPVGNVYVGGSYRNPMTSHYTIGLAKYSQDGDLLWSTTYGNFAGQSSIDALTVDPAGNLYASIYEKAGPGEDPVVFSRYLTVVFDYNGNQSWVSTINGQDVGAGVSMLARMESGGSPSIFQLDSHDNGSLELGSDSHGIITIKHNSIGGSPWIRHYSAGYGADSGVSMAVSATGDVYVAGQSKNSNGNQDFVVIKYDESGNELWVQRYDTGEDDTPRMALVLRGIHRNL
jgi:hypothetical protein